MKKSVLAILLLGALVLPAVASASPLHQGPYFAGFIGVTIPESSDATSFDGFGVYDERIKFDPGFTIGGAVGYDAGPIRFEGELSYKDLPIDSVAGDKVREGNVDATAIMGNVFIDLHNGTPITPYLGAGLGFAALHLDETYSRTTDYYGSDDQAVFAYQVGGGLEISLNRQLSLDLAYRYFRTSEASFATDVADTDFEIATHNATVGLRVTF